MSVFDTHDIHCGSCATKSIPKRIGIYYCHRCDQGHEVEYSAENDVFIVHPYPRFEEDEVDV